MLVLSSQSIRKIIVAGLLFCLSTCRAAWEREDGTPFDRGDLPARVRPVRGGVWLSEDFRYYKTNQVMYLHKDGAYFFDASWTPAGARQILWKAAASTYGDFLGIVLTGPGLHRSGGLSEFRRGGVPVLAPRATVAALPRVYREEHARWTREFSTLRVETDPPAIDRSFEGDLELLDGRVRVLFVGPAHTAGSCVVLFPREKILYGGDVLAEPLLFPERLDLAGMERALRRVEALPADSFTTIISGHGRAEWDRGLLQRVRLELRRLAAHAARPAPGL